MVAQIVLQVLTQLRTILGEEAKQRGRLVLGAEKDVNKLVSTFRSIEALLLDAEEKQLRQHTVRLWVERLKDVSYEIDDVLDEWRTEILKRQSNDQLEDDDSAGGWLKLQLVQMCNVLRRVCPLLPAYCFSCGEIGLRYDIAVRIKGLNERLGDIAKEKDEYNFIVYSCDSTTTFQSLERFQTSSNIRFSEVKGRVKEREALVMKLLADDQGDHVQVISILGTGGIGKTTLAKLVYNDRKVEAFFPDRIWICVSDTFDANTIAKAILGSLTGTSQCDVPSEVLRRIQATTKNKRFLLVLDDVWEHDWRKWEELMISLSHCCCSPGGSRILVTTRNKEVCHALRCRDSNVLSLGKLSKGECREVFTQVAFFEWTAEEMEDVEDVCDEMVDKCNGLPLAAKVLGGVVQSKRSRRDWVQVVGSELWQLEEAKAKVLGPIALSYYDLPPAVRQCFHVCAAYPKDFTMDKAGLVNLWMALGFLEPVGNQDMKSVGEKYFDALAMRSFFQDLKTESGWLGNNDIVRCKMHDLVHDFAMWVSNHECSSMIMRNLLLIGSTPTTTTTTTTTTRTTPVVVRHLVVDVPYGMRVPLHACHLPKQLRSLEARHVEVDGEPDFYTRLHGVRSLVLRYSKLKGIPSTISHLIHLRCLDLSWNSGITELPEEICELYNLWSLLLNGIHNLEKLPAKMGQLVNLKRLENQDLPAQLPKSIANITGLKALTVFNIIGHDSSNEGEEWLLEIGDLEKMNQLQGTMVVRGLGNVVDPGEVDRAQFAKKEFPTLWLDFGRGDGDEYRRDEDLLEALKPSPCLEQLDLCNYLGMTMLPSWLISSLANLKRLCLTSFPNLEVMPPLGDLPSLEVLHVTLVASRVKKLGAEFLGTKRGGGRRIGAAFPKLTELRFMYMNGWTEWEEWEEEEDMLSTVMPRLRSFMISRCTKLWKLPDMLLRKTTLERLEIYGGGGLEGYQFPSWNPEMVPLETWRKICHIPSIILEDVNIRHKFNLK